METRAIVQLDLNISHHSNKASSNELVSHVFKSFKVKACSHYKSWRWEETQQVCESASSLALRRVETGDLVCFYGTFHTLKATQSASQRLKTTIEHTINTQRQTHARAQTHCTYQTDMAGHRGLGRGKRTSADCVETWCCRCSSSQYQQDTRAVKCNMAGASSLLISAGQQRKKQLLQWIWTSDSRLIQRKQFNSKRWEQAQEEQSVQHVEAVGKLSSGGSCSAELRVRPCGANQEFGSVYVRVENLLLPAFSPIFKPKAASSRLKQND